MGLHNDFLCIFRNEIQQYCPNTSDIDQLGGHSFHELWGQHCCYIHKDDRDGRES